MFDDFSGNVHREIDDLEVWGGVGEHQLVWKRFGNSRAPGTTQWLGTAGNWRHTYQWEITWDGQTSFFDVFYPDGTVNRFTQSALVPGEWRSTPSITDIIFQQGSSFTLQMKNGWRYHFEKFDLPNGGVKMHLQDFTDSQGNVYTLTYAGLSRLTRVTEPAGRFLEVTWQKLSIDQSAGTIFVIAEVATSDGRRVKYDYQAIVDTTLPFDYQALVSAHYGDGTQAVYTYSQVFPSTRPLLASAIDPRYKGPGVNMKYEYFSDTSALGTVQREINGVDGTVVATLSIANGNAFHPVVTYGNGSEQVFSQSRTGSQLQAKLDGLGRKSRYTYDQNGFGFLLSSQDPLGRLTQFENTTFGNWSKVTYPDGSSESWTRDSLDLVLTHTDEGIHTTTFTRDSNHRVSQIDCPDGTSEQFTFNPFGQVLTHTMRNNGFESFVYNGRGLKTQHTDALGNIATYTYDSADRLASVKNARDCATTYAYNERGLLTKITHPDNSFRTYAYDNFGNRTGETNELGKAWLYTYDEFRRLTSVTDPLNRVTQYNYGIGPDGCSSCHAEAKPTEIILPSGKITKIDYDVEWQKTTNTVGFETLDAATTQYAYDAAGNLTRITDPNTNIWTFTYDSRNRLATSADPLGNTTAWTYDFVGNMKTETRPDGGLTRYDAYDPMNRLLKVTDPKAQVTEFTYDAEGNTKTLTDARGNVYTYDYDLLTRRVELKFPDASHELWTYDSVGNVSNYVTRAGQTKTCTYDCRNRETLCDWSDSTPDVSKTYDEANRLLAISSSVSLLSYTYDDANQLLSETQDVSGGSIGRTISYDYDEDGNRISTIYPASESLSYTYTGRNQVATVILNSVPNKALAIYTYDLAGNRISKTLLNDTIASYTYDDANRMTSVEHKNGQAPFARFDYDYDSVNRRKFVKRDNASGDVYVYDAIDQVTGVQYEATNPDTTPTSPLRTVGYDYDKVGNRATVTEDGTPTIYNANNLNEYTQVGAALLTYDGNGNLATHNGWTYTYDAQNRLVGAANGVTTATFAYDARNRCVKRVFDGSTAFFYYDGWNLIEEDRGPLDPDHTRYFHGAWVDELLIKQTDLDTQYYHHDSLGNVTHLTDGAGNVSEQYAYDIFGAVTIEDGQGTTPPASAVGNRFLLTGREYLSELSLYDYRNRFYWPGLGRFLQTDPIRFDAGEINLYAYVGNDPINYWDPDGLDATGWGGDGRGISEGPINGNWGGGNWSGGLNPSKHGGKAGPAAPTDSGDECYKRHDDCYDKCDSLSDAPTVVPGIGRNGRGLSPRAKCRADCDGTLVNEAEALPKDSKKWPKPPRKGTEKDSEKFRDDAIWYFKK